MKKALRTCKKCGDIMPDKVKYCAKCGAKFGMSKKIKILIGVIVVLFFGAIGSHNNKQEKIKEQQRVAAQEKEKQEADEKAQKAKEEAKKLQEKQQTEQKAMLDKIDADAKARESEQNSQPSQQQSSSTQTTTTPAPSQTEKIDIIADSSSHVYHLPTQRHYNIKPGNQVHFSSEQEAQSAGYHKSLK